MPNVAELDLPSRLDLINIESRLGSGEVTYYVEDSSLSVVNASFPKIEQRSFTDWIDHYARKGKTRILEFNHWQ